MSAWQPMWDKVLEANPIADAIALDLDYRNDRYRALDSGILVEKPWADILNNYSAPAGRTYFDSSGVLQTAAANEMIRAFDPATGGLLGNQIFGAATNLFINSNSPATQSISVTAQTYTLSIYGTGSVTLSGASTGVLNGVATNQRQTLTFTPTAGSLTLTVSGAVVYPQLQTGAAATPYIQTGGSPVTVAAENQIIDGSVFSDIYNPSRGTFVAIARNTNGSGYLFQIDAGGSANRRLLRMSDGGGVTGFSISDGSANFASAGNPWVANARKKGAFSFVGGGTGRVSSDGLVSALGDNSPPGIYRMRIGSGDSSTSYLNGYIERLVLFNRALPPSILQRLTA